MNSISDIKIFLKDHILELEGYLQGDDYDEMEKHDIRIAIEECEYIYCEIERMEEAKTI